MKEGVRDIEERTTAFAVRILKMADSIPMTHSGTMIARQIVRSGASIGANVQEAQEAHSKKDFIRRMNIARAGALETKYWLRLLRDTGLIAGGLLTGIMDEAEQLVRILTAIVKNARLSSTTAKIERSREK